MALEALAQGRKGEKTVASRGMQIFLLIWFGQMVSLIGSGMTCFAQSVTAYTDLRGTISNLAILASLATLPGIFLSPIAGVLADRWDRRWMMITCDTVAAMATLGLRILVVTHVYQIWHMYIITIIIAIANHFQWPAYFASISSLVPKRNLGNANGLVAMSRAMGEIAAPFMAGIAVARFKLGGVILFDLATYLFALVTMLIARIPKPEAKATPETGKISLWKESLYGWKYLLARPGFMGLLMVISIGEFVVGGITLILLPFALAISSIQVYGTVLSIGALSMLVGSILVGMWGGPKNRIRGVLGCLAIQGVAILLVGMKPVISVLLAAAILFYFVVPIINACGNTIWQTKVPFASQGRVLAASVMATALGTQLGILITGPVVDYGLIPMLNGGSALAKNLLPLFGTGRAGASTLVFAIFGVIYVMTAVGGFFYPRLRHLEKELPDVTPEEGAAGVQMVSQPVGATLYEFDLGGNVLSSSIGRQSAKDKNLGDN